MKGARSPKGVKILLHGLTTVDNVITEAGATNLHRSLTIVIPLPFSYNYVSKKWRSTHPSSDQAHNCFAMLLINKEGSTKSEEDQKSFVLYIMGQKVQRNTLLMPYIK